MFEQSHQEAKWALRNARNWEGGISWGWKAKIRWVSYLGITSVSQLSLQTMWVQINTALKQKLSLI